VYILEKDGVTFTIDSVTCDASSSPVKDDLVCFVPLTTLRAAPYNLVYNDLVIAKARAQN